MGQEQPSLRGLRQFWRAAADLVAVLAVVVLAILVVFLPDLDESLVRAVVGIAFVLFVPGYALVAALFPEAGRPSTARDRDGAGGGIDRFFFLGRDREVTAIDGLERVALAFALSIALVSLLVVGLTLTPLEFTPVQTLLTISAVTVMVTVVAAIRRWKLPEDQRFRVSYREWIATGAESVTDADSRVDAIVNVALAVAIVFAVGTITFAVVAPPDGEQFTDFYLLTEDDDGELVAAGYPTEFTVGDRTPVVLGITNQEQEPMNYTVVVELHRVTRDRQGNTTTISVLEEEELDRFHTRVEHTETWQRTYPVEPTMTGENLRLTFLLYRGEPPANPTVENVYREVHLWVTVDEEAT